LLVVEECLLLAAEVAVELHFQVYQLAQVKLTL
jgi:hypothetical protein